MSAISRQLAPPSSSFTARTVQSIVLLMLLLQYFRNQLRTLGSVTYRAASITVLHKKRKYLLHRLLGNVQYLLSKLRLGIRDTFSLCVRVNLVARLAYDTKVVRLAVEPVHERANVVHR